MPNRINELLYKEYDERFRDVGNLVSIGYEGLPISAQDKLRADMAEKEIGLCFVKNRIVNIVFRDQGRTEVKDICNGQTAFAYGEDPVAIARFVMDFAKQHEEVKVHGALVENTLLDTNGVKDLSKSPSKDELKAQIVGQALGPGGKIAAALNGPAQTIAGQVKTLIENLEKESA